jgi:hypothetical protein
MPGWAHRTAWINPRIDGNQNMMGQSKVSKDVREICHGEVHRDINCMIGSTCEDSEISKSIPSRTPNNQTMVHQWTHARRSEFDRQTKLGRVKLEHMMRELLLLDLSDSRFVRSAKVFTIRGRTKRPSLFQQ